MNIVIGRGNKRKVFALPCAQVFKRAPEAEQEKTIHDLCIIAGVVPSLYQELVK